MAVTVLVYALARLGYVGWVGTPTALVVLCTAAVLDRILLLGMRLVMLSWSLGILLCLLGRCLDGRLNHLLRRPTPPLGVTCANLLGRLNLRFMTALLPPRSQLSS